MSATVTLISLICAIFGAFMGVLGYKRLAIKDIEDSSKENAVIATKLDFISQIVTNIQVKMEVQEKKFEDFNIRLTRCEESSKSAHKRLDEIEEIKIKK